LIVLAIGAVATAVIQTSVYTQLIAVATAVSGLATTARMWLKKLDAFADTGKEFENEQDMIRQAVINEVTAAHDKLISGLRTQTANRLAIVNKLDEELKRH